MKKNTFENALARISFNSKDKCWPWLGCFDRKGYGRIRFHGKTLLVTRLLWEKWKGPISPKVFLCHTCDNPACVNPYHLYEGNHKTNAVDASNRKRHRGAKKTICSKGHALTSDNTRIAKRKDGRSFRVCRICANQ